MLGRLGLGFANVTIVVLLAAGCGDSVVPVGSGGNGGAIAGGCASTRDCPSLEDPCWKPICLGGTCDTMPAPAETVCGGGRVCDGNGSCGECARDADCKASEELACQAPSCQGGTCTIAPKKDGTACSGGVCTSGSCLPECTMDTDCVPTASCQIPTCADGRCDQHAAPDGLACDWKGLSIATCHTGNCLVCKDVSCDAIDTREPNEAQASATDLGGHSDCEHYGFCAALNEGDVDWFTYQGSDTFGCNVAPSVDFDAPGLEVCQYWQCDAVPTLDTCPDGATKDTAPGGQVGCCSDKPFSYDPCNGGPFDSEDAHVWIKVTRTGGSGCTPYAIGFEF